MSFWPSEDDLLGVFEDAPDDEFPSLLEVAVHRNNKSLIKSLLVEGADGHDSFALRTAIILGNSSELLTMLMDASENARPQNRRDYGSSALREAIHTRNADSVRLLAGRVDVNEFESKVLGSLSTPLNKSIKTYKDNGIETVRLLLKNGADPNSLATFHGLGGEPDEKSLLWRTTAMLAAIDTNHLPMVQLLVDHGADVNLPPNFGVTRTPLQRAAERGNFAISQYLLEKGTEVDGLPVYSDGTALQLAAIGGYVGVAHSYWKKVQIQTPGQHMKTAEQHSKALPNEVELT
ncbi:ankyrin [Lepidopterella palustris CBS 459.81]|uniref:Ankyrin n=1 Tax=Lepidopterella palustris CBS 459.81 TaxID=1314670 RepID=A0A8E2DXH2_9PEZI|nr:ankyrin [Lepidopterella palustris CBS 459.81]